MAGVAAAAGNDDDAIGLARTREVPVSGLKADRIAARRHRTDGFVRPAEDDDEAGPGTPLGVSIFGLGRDRWRNCLREPRAPEPDRER